MASASAPATAQELFRRSPFTALALFGLGNFFLAQLGDRISPPGAPVATFWLPSGVFLAALLSAPRKLWVAVVVVILCAETAFHQLHGHPAPAIVGHAVIHSTTAILAAVLLQRFVPQPMDFRALRPTLRFLALAVVIPTFLSALLGTIAGTAGLGPEFIPRDMLVHWAGSAVGTILLIPLLSPAPDPASATRKPHRRGELLCTLGAICLVCWFAMDQEIAQGVGLKYLSIPIVGWATIRNGTRAGMATILAVALVFALRIARDPVADSDWGAVANQTLALQFFIVVLAVSGLVLGALLAEREGRENALREKEERLTQAVNLAQLAYWEFEAAGRTFVFNDQFYTLYGTTAAREGGYRMSAETYAHEFLLPDDRELVATEIQRVLAGHPSPTPHRIEHRIRRRDGALRFLHVQIVLLLDASGRTIGSRGANQDITERKNAEAAQMRLLHILESTINEIYIFSADDFHFEYANRSALRNLGYPLAELQKKTPADITVGVSLEQVRESVIPLGSGRCESLMLEAAHRRRDGSQYPVEVHLQHICFSDRPVFLAVISDITDRRLAESALRESEVRFRTLADSGQALIWTAGLDKKCNYFNQVWLAFTGRSLGQELGEGWTEGIHPDDLTRCLSTYNEAFDRRGRFSMDYRLRHRDGTYHWIQDNGSPRHDSLGAFLGYIGHCLDITDRKRAEQALRESEEKFSKIFRDAPVLIAISDLATGVYLDVNDKTLSVSGYSREEMIGHTAPELGWVTAEQRNHLVQTLRQQGRISGLELTMCSRTGERRTGLFGGEEIRIAGRPCLLTVASDITERRRNEEQLQQSLHEKEALLKEVHHRVKNNLQIISSLLRLQAAKIAHPAAAGAIQDMQSRIRSMAILHETLYRSGNLARVDLATYLQAIGTQALRSFGHHCGGTIELDCRLTSALVDATQAVPCGLLVNELILNCLKHAFPAGRSGTVRIDLAPCGSPAGPADEVLQLSVSDDGIGFQETLDLQNLRSLGLQLVTDLARQLHSTLDIRPNRPSGTYVGVVFAPAA